MKRALPWANWLLRTCSLLCLSLVGVLVFLVPVQAQGLVEYVERFDTAIVLNQDASMRVTETLVYNFGSLERHGIYRDVPVSYKTDLGNRSTAVSNISVTDQSGAAYPFSTARSGVNERIKIGDPDKTVKGTKTYVISYTVSRMIGYFSQFDELYWNATGNAWVVPIGEASVVLTLPKPILKENLSISCYEGKTGSTESCTSLTDVASGTVRTISYTASHSFAAGEGLTIAIGFPKGVVYQPTRFERILASVKDNWVIGIPLLVLLGMFIHWYRKGRDPHGRGTIVPQYEAPKGMMPLEMYMLMHDRVSNNAISSEIIFLATRGYLTVAKTDGKTLVFSTTDYVLTKLKPGDDLPTAEKALFDGLFTEGDEVRLSALKDHFYKNISIIKKATTESVIAKNYFATDPNMTRTWYVLAGGAVMFVAFYLGSFGALAAVSGALSGAIVILFGLFMPKVTKTGARAREEVQGLKMYMDVAEKDRINFHNAPSKNPALFETLLPFAMILGVEKAWAKQFEGIYTAQPSWYSDPGMHGFSPILFTNDLHSFSSGAAATLASAPGGSSGSGGGGSSGGGFGGGGGGSW